MGKAIEQIDRTKATGRGGRPRKVAVQQQTNRKIGGGINPSRLQQAEFHQDWESSKGNQNPLKERSKVNQKIHLPKSRNGLSSEAAGVIQ
jgi:hypothetical protein